MASPRPADDNSDDQAQGRTARPGPGAGEATARAVAESERAGGWRERMRRLAFPAMLALVLCGAQFAVERRLEFNIAEEGFLWYGARATARGEVPLRDFYSYDPGRYYWAAAWALPLGDGILALRAAAAAFQTVGLALGLLAARRALRGRLALAAAGLLLLVWMVPRNKLFEPALAMAVVYCAVLLVERPSRRRHFAAGAFVGIAGFFGKNHGAYAGAALLALILFLHWRRDRLRSGRAESALPGISNRETAAGGGLGLTPKLLAWVAGVGAGASPLLLLALLRPGFFASYVDTIRFFLEAGRTNFPLAVPWPWRGSSAGPDAGWIVLDPRQRLALGCCFVLLPLFCAAALIVLGRLERRRGRASSGPPGSAISELEAARRGAAAGPSEPCASEVPTRERNSSPALLLAALPVAACYMHHAFSRADLVHLAESIHPLLLGCLALPGAVGAALGGSGRARRGVAALVGVLLAGLTLATVLPANLLYQRLFPDRPGTRLVPCEVGGEELLIRARKAVLLGRLEQVIAAHVGPGEPLLLAPDLPGLYAALGRRSPVWDIYPIWPATPRLDERMAGELERQGVRWALIHTDYRLDNRPALDFASTHPRVAALLARRFEPLTEPGLPPGYALFRRRGAGR